MKPLSQWAEEDLRFLISNKLGETILREYKQTISVASSSEKRELCKDVSAMANSQGGLIIFGLAETRIENSGSVPEKLVPIEDQTLKERAQQVLLDGVQPRLEFRFYSTPSSDGTGEYVMVEIPKSLRGLHMVTLDKDNRYYIRRDYQSVPMTPFEIEEAYRQYALKELQAQAHIDKYKLPNPNESLPFPKNAWLSFTMVSVFPVSNLFGLVCSMYRGEIPDMVKGLTTSDGVLGADQFAPNYYGMLSTRSGAGTVQYYHQIYREGAMHFGRILDLRGEAVIRSIGLVGYLHDMLSLAVGVFAHAGYWGPVRFQVEMSQIKNFELAGGGGDVKTVFQHESFLHSVDTTVRDAIESSVTVLKEVHYHLWQSFGYYQCYMYVPNDSEKYEDRVMNSLRLNLK